MAIRHLLQRLSPSLDRRWIIALVVLAVLAVIATTFVRWKGPLPPLRLVALGPQASFQDTVAIPASWADTTAEDPDVVARFPLVLAVVNPGFRAVQPERLELSLPVRYRIAAPGEDIEPRVDPSSPLVTYALRPGLGVLHPQRLPELLPAYDTLWLEVVIPSYYCVSVADSIPEFVAAPPPPLGSMKDVRIFYSFEGGDLDRRLTGVLGVTLDTMAMRRVMPPQPPSFPMETGREVAAPDLGTLRYVGSRQATCGDPADPLEILTSVWENPGGARFYALDYGGAVRKHFYDLDGDGILDRESWDPDGDGVFDATRRARLPVPAFLLPRAPSRYDLAALDSLPPDSLARLDVFRRAMTGPGPMPRADSAALRAAAATGQPAPAPGAGPVFAPGDTLPRPVIRPPRPSGPLGTPVRPDSIGG